MNEKETTIVSALREGKHYSATQVAQLAFDEFDGRKASGTLRKMEARGHVHSHFDASLGQSFYGLGPVTDACHSGTG